MPAALAADVRDRDNEPVAPCPLETSEFEHVERSDITQEEVKRMIWEEVQEFHAQQRRESQEQRMLEEQQRIAQLQQHLRNGGTDPMAED